MAATRQVAGILREVWSEAVAQGPGAQVVTTGIRISTAQLARVQALLVATSVAGVPVFGGALSIVDGRLVVTVTNSGAPGSTATWTLDITLNHSLQQANALGTVPPVLVASGSLGGLGAPQTLAQTYTVGATRADQTIALTDADGFGVVIDARGLVTPEIPFEIRLGNMSAPVQLSRYSPDASMSPELGVVLNFLHARGTLLVPEDLHVSDTLGSMEFVGRNLNLNTFGGLLRCITTAIVGGLSTALDLFVSKASVPKHALQIDANVNLCVAAATPGTNAAQTIVLPEAGTVAPTAGTAGRVHIFAALIGDACAEPFGTALAWTSEANVVVGAPVPNHSIPVIFNGLPYLLSATLVI